LAIVSSIVFSFGSKPDIMTLYNIHIFSVNAFRQPMNHDTIKMFKKVKGVKSSFAVNPPGRAFHERINARIST